MDPLELQATIYLGDRAIKRIVLDGWERRVKIQIDSISRIRSPDGLWHFYADEDIEDGFLVFGNLEAFAIDPAGGIPDGYLGQFRIWQSEKPSGEYFMELHTAGLTPSGEGREIVLRATFGVFYLEDPAKTGEQITT